MYNVLPYKLIFTCTCTCMYCLLSISKGGGTLCAHIMCLQLHVISLQAGIYMYMYMYVIAQFLLILVT